MLKLKAMFALLLAKRWYVATESRLQKDHRVISRMRYCQHIQAIIEQDAFLMMQREVDEKVKEDLSSIADNFHRLFDKVDKN